MKTKAVKARKRHTNNTGKFRDTFSTWELPADAESYDRMVRRGALAIGSRAYRDSKATDINDPACYTRKPEAKDIEFYSKYARAVLASFGITRPATRKA